MSDAEQKAKILEQFKKLDKNNEGSLDHTEIKSGIKAIYSEINLCLSDADIDRMIKTADVNGDGKLFVRL